MKRIKMLLYGEPGVGKSTFAVKAPKPYFVTTDGNYEFLEEFGADPEAHTQVSSWSEAKKLFASDVFDDYETIVIDLLEDLFKWCEYEYCTRNRIDHVSDIGYGKGYDSSRNEFFIEICKLIGLEKNIILIMHGTTFMQKDRRGVEHPKHAPSTRLPDKVLDMIEGRVRFCLRCYLKDEEQDGGVLVKKRFLSLVPKPNEFGIIRGINENSVPHDIPLDFNCFADAIGFDMTEKDTSKPDKKVVKKNEKKDVVKNEVVAEDKDAEAAPATQTEVVKLDNDDTDGDNATVNTDETTQPVLAAETESTETANVENTAVEETSVEEAEKPADTQKTEPAKKPEAVDNNDKLAAIRAKLAAINGAK